MGIVKVRQRGPGYGTDARQSSSTSALGVVAQQDKLLLEKDPGNDSDDEELADVGCELAMVGDWVCSIPYELFDLPDLKEILSLETWNSCLTEEERFSLTAYLPDMDHETFCVTMKDLVSGSNFFFGSPLGEIYRRLKGGYYSLKVTQSRRCLQLLQRRRYYHSLKSYHESMSRKFADMSKTWCDLEPSIGVDERIRIWNNLKISKPILLVDLNAFPADEEILCKADKMATSIPLLKKPKYPENEGVTQHASLNMINESTVKAKTKAKGVLKIRPVEANSKQNHLALALPTAEPWGFCRQPPKGVLKIRPKNNLPAQQERITAVPLLPEFISSGQSSLPMSGFYPQPFPSSWKQENLNKELPLLHHSFADIRMNKLSESADVQLRENFLNISSQFYKRKMRNADEMRLHDAQGFLSLKSNQNYGIHSDEVGSLLECQNGEDLRLNSGQLSSLEEPYPFPLAHQGRRQVAPAIRTVSRAISRIASVSSDKHAVFPIPSDLSEHRRMEHSDELEKLSFHQTDSVLQREDHEFPITYKRKKSCSKLGTMDSFKQPSAVVNSESAVPTEKTKPIKIRVKGFSDYNVQLKQGVLNGLPHGSTST